MNTISDHPLPVPVVWVSKEVLRKYFNEHVLEKVQRGELQCELRTEKHLKVPPTGEPFLSATLGGQEIASWPIEVIINYIEG